MSNFTPTESLNAFYCVLLSLGLLSTQIGLLGIISSSLLIYKINQDSKLLVDDSDICSLQEKGKQSGNQTVECGNSCGLLTCPGFSLEKEATELCNIAQECTRGRFSAAGLGLIFSLIQTGLVIYYIATVFIEWDFMAATDFKARWCTFTVCHGIYLIFTLIPMTLALFFNQGHVPKNPYLKPSLNSKGESCDGNSIGILFVSWCGINVGFCIVTILLILYFQLIRKNPQDVIALNGVENEGTGNVILYSGTKKEDRRKTSSFVDESVKDEKESNPESNSLSSPGGILGGKKPAGRHSNSLERGKHKRKYGKRPVGGTGKVSSKV